MRATILRCLMGMSGPSSVLALVRTKKQLFVCCHVFLFRVYVHKAASSLSRHSLFICCLITGPSACKDAASGYEIVGGYIGSIKDSCKGEDSCYEAAKYGGYIAFIDKACLAEDACYYAAKEFGSINGAGISKACLTPASCYGVAYSLALDAVISSGITNCVCDTCAGALDDESLPDECGDKLDFGELLDELEDIIKSKTGN